MASNATKGRFAGQFLRSRFNNLGSSPNDTESHVNIEEDSQEDAEDMPNVESFEWLNGRRVVELKVLADHLDGCKNCEKPLRLSRCTGESRYGLSSILTIPCDNCQYLNKIPTGSSHRAKAKGMPVWDSNSKLALAMLHTGLGPYQVASFLSAINIPPIDPKNLKRREEEIGISIEQCAQQSCDDYLQEEIKSAKTDNEIRVSFDGAWQRRGSGRGYNSLSGHATVIGENTSKCIAYGVRSLDCKKCSAVNEKGDAQREHDCRKNHTGSAKAMEPCLAVDMVQQITKKGAKVTHFTGDNDSTTIARIRTSVNPDIIKVSDKNHCRKAFTNEMYELQKKHKQLSVTVINYLVKDISYAIEQNKGKPDALRAALLAVIPHAFGHHDQCNKDWCGYLQNPDNFRYSSLPYGKPLTDEGLFEDLSRLFQKKAEDSESLSQLGSSQGNESLNQIISTKAPKWKHFGGSSSLNFRVASGIAQKNIGRKYLIEVNKRVSLSPGKFTARTAARLSQKRALEKNKETERRYKRQRLQKKSKKRTASKAAEVREGPTYQTEVGESLEININEIPGPIVERTLSKPGQPIKKVYFDLETTGFEHNAEIVQIAAVSQDKHFERYILPQKKINPHATKATHLSVRNNKLYHRNVQVDTCLLNNAITDFIDFLPCDNCTLIGHNMKSFDSRILIKSLIKTANIELFMSKNVIFADTLPLFRQMFPNFKHDGYKQSTLATKLLSSPQQYDAHNAIDDVLMLRDLVHQSKINDDDLFKFSFSVSDVLESLKVSERVASLSPLRGKITNGMVQKIARSGMNLHHLKLAFTRSGRDGVISILKESVHGKPRVTSNKRILDAIVSALDETTVQTS